MEHEIAYGVKNNILSQCFWDSHCLGFFIFVIFFRAEESSFEAFKVAHSAHKVTGGFR